MSDSIFQNPPQIPESVDHLVEKLAVKPAESVGQTLSDIWFLVFGGISQLAERRRAKYAHDIQLFKDELESNITSIPADKTVEPKVQIVMSALSDAQYCVEEESLRKMFVNLITSSINSDSASKVHPSFSDILRKMSPLDAENMKLFRLQRTRPLGKYLLLHKEGSGFSEYQSYVFLGNPKNSDLAAQSRSISALNALGLVNIDFDSYLVNEAEYKPFEVTTRYLEAKKIASDNGVKYKGADLQKGLVSLTPLGADFLDVCVPIKKVRVSISPENSMPPRY